MDKPILIRNAETGQSLMFEFRVGMRPSYVFYRAKAFLECWGKTRHAPNPHSGFYFGDNGPWWVPCECGYFGIVRED